MNACAFAAQVQHEIGGNAKAAIYAAVTDPKADQFTKIREFLVKNAEFNKDKHEIVDHHTMFLHDFGSTQTVRMATEPSDIIRMITG